MTSALFCVTASQSDARQCVMCDSRETKSGISPQKKKNTTEWDTDIPSTCYTSSGLPVEHYCGEDYTPTEKYNCEILLSVFDNNTNQVAKNYQFWIKCHWCTFSCDAAQMRKCVLSIAPGHSCRTISSFTWKVELLRIYPLLHMHSDLIQHSPVCQNLQCHLLARPGLLFATVQPESWENHLRNSNRCNGDRGLRAKNSASAKMESTPFIHYKEYSTLNWWLSVN